MATEPVEQFVLVVSVGSGLDSGFRQASHKQKQASDTQSQGEPKFNVWCVKVGTSPELE